jgi:site-specific recombinase XerD
LEKHAKPNKRSWKEDQRMLYKDVRPSWGKRKAKNITRRNVIQLLDKIKERGSPIVANRTLACVRRMFNFAIKRGLLDSSPCIMIEAPAKENRRDRYLSTAEIKVFWHEQTYLL